MVCATRADKTQVGNLGHWFLVDNISIIFPIILLTISEISKAKNMMFNRKKIGATKP